jgi:hypothetical protein
VASCLGAVEFRPFFLRLDRDTSMGHKRKAGVLEDEPTLVVGSSAGASSTPTFKRARKVAPGTATKTAILEKRAARIRTTCPKNIQERVARVMSQRYSHFPIPRNLVQLNQIFYDRTREKLKRAPRNLQGPW